MIFPTTYHAWHTFICSLPTLPAYKLHEGIISLLCSLPYLKNQDHLLAHGRHWMKICWMNEKCAGYAGKAAKMVIPLTRPHFYLLIISAYLMPGFHQGKRRISIFLSIFQTQATLTSVLFQLVYKNKYPAKTVSKTVQDARTNSFLSTFPGQQQTQDDLLVPFCQNALQPCSN